MANYSNSGKEVADEAPRNRSRGIQKRAQTNKTYRTNKTYQTNQKGPGSSNRRAYSTKQNNFKKFAKRTETQKRNDAKVANKEAEKAEIERAQREKVARVQEYKKKRQQKNKVISKKTRHGQPLMKDRMNLLLQQIQKIKRT